MRRPFESYSNPVRITGSGHEASRGTSNSNLYKPSAPPLDLTHTTNMNSWQPNTWMFYFNVLPQDPPRNMGVTSLTGYYHLSTSSSVGALLTIVLTSICTVRKQQTLIPVLPTARRIFRNICNILWNLLLFSSKLPKSRRHPHPQLWYYQPNTTTMIRYTSFQNAWICTASALFGRDYPVSAFTSSVNFATLPPFDFDTPPSYLRSHFISACLQALQ